MHLTAEEIDIGSRTPTVLLNATDVAELGAHPLDRVRIRHDGGVSTGIVEVTDELVAPGRLGVTRALGHVTGTVDVTLAPRPEAVTDITKKLDDIELEAHELEAIVTDIDEDRLNDVELSAFVAGVYANGLSREETRHLTRAMIDAGERIEWDRAPIVDKHSIGGVAGNRVTPVVVGIVAAAGLTIPKTSSRAVTSAAGTADTMAVLCDVEFTVDEIRAIVEETGGCVVWGGGVQLSPVDDKIIRAETPLSLDPPGQLIASVLSKKVSAGATHVVIDIPYGEGAKVEALSDAREMAEDFGRVGRSLGLEIDCAVTRGGQPVGRGIGPVLEARDVLAVLDGAGPADLRTKSVRLAQILLDATDHGASAADLLESGAADAKLREILAAQGGDPTVTPDDLTPGSHEATLSADRDGVVTHVHNRSVNELARRAGAPTDHGAGVRLECAVGDELAAGDPLATVYAETAEKLEQAVTYAGEVDAIRLLAPDEAVIERH